MNNTHNLTLQRDKLRRTVDEAAKALAAVEAKLSREQLDRIELLRRINAERTRKGLEPYPADCTSKAKMRAFAIHLRKQATEARKK